MVFTDCSLDIEPDVPGTSESVTPVCGTPLCGIPACGSPALNTPEGGVAAAAEYADTIVFLIHREITCGEIRAPVFLSDKNN
jgi:hypothetical protein